MSGCLYQVNKPRFSRRRLLSYFGRPPSTFKDKNHLHITSFKMAQAALGLLYKLAIPAAVGTSLLQASMYDVPGGKRAVIFDRLAGVKPEVVNEGTHFLIPWLQKSIVYDVRTKPRQISTTTGSKDLQMVTLSLRVLHRPEVQQLPKIYQVCHVFFPQYTHLTNS
jgi:regulator of protease activity HflC (stomatin/prohibitin superfamily)